MKNLIYISIFLISANFYAQDKPRSMSETTEVKTVKVNNGEEVVENKIKVTTREEKKVKLDKADADKVNQARVMNSDKMVTKTIEIDNDNDPFYDSEIELVSYIQNGKEYNFVKNANGFTVTKKNAKGEYANAMRSTLDGRYYIFNNKEYSGIGYFDGDGSFVVEYYDNDSNSLLTTKFMSIKTPK
ncbi:hypothetical protein [Hanstruepera ponticola]|uniref:hypothetical protein n=1 Tax=Hanstruepera ponticola TaxID=2042995 RepID=UPI000CF0FBB9|nr:hypothetical protein [Hanstruepera ponticola]